MWKPFKLGTLESKYSPRFSCFNTCPEQDYWQKNQGNANLHKQKSLKSKLKWIFLKKRLMIKGSKHKNLLPKSFSVDLITTWTTLSAGIFKSSKQSSAIIICLGLRWAANGSCSNTWPTWRRILGSLANQPAMKY